MSSGEFGDAPILGPDGDNFGLACLDGDTLGLEEEINNIKSCKVVQDFAHLENLENYQPTMQQTNENNIKN
jgi:hypothetical protein